jgi:two-component system response regulator AtoC
VAVGSPLLKLAFQAEPVKKHGMMNPRILFVDDEPPIRELLSLYFNKKGFEVSTVASGVEAMEIADQERLGAAIVDLNLGGEDGLELLGFLKSNHPKVPVIVFTGLPDKDLQTKAMAGGASAFMSKSDSLDKLYAEVISHIPVG